MSLVINEDRVFFGQNFKTVPYEEGVIGGRWTELTMTRKQLSEEYIKKFNDTIERKLKFDSRYTEENRNDCIAFHTRWEAIYDSNTFTNSYDLGEPAYDVDEDHVTIYGLHNLGFGNKHHFVHIINPPKSDKLYIHSYNRHRMFDELEGENRYDGEHYVDVVLGVPYEAYKLVYDYMDALATLSLYEPNGDILEHMNQIKNSLHDMGYDESHQSKTAFIEFVKNNEHLAIYTEDIKAVSGSVAYYFKPYKLVLDKPKFYRDTLAPQAFSLADMAPIMWVCDRIISGKDLCTGEDIKESEELTKEA